MVISFVTKQLIPILKRIVNSIGVYLLRVLIAFDVFLNTVLGGRSNETLSSRAYKHGTKENNKFWFFIQTLIDLLFSPIETNHCKKAYHYIRKPPKQDKYYMDKHDD